LAEKRRIALKDALEENKKLSEKKKELVQRVEELEEENRICKEMLDETKVLVEVLQVISFIYHMNIVKLFILYLE
jgi:uncharacterized protein with NRDE domain